MISTILISIYAGICGMDDVSTQMIRRPLLIAPVVGLIMGDLQTGLLIGATLEVMWMGIGSVGAYTAPDMITGTAIGTGIAIASGGGVPTAIALAVPSSLLAQQLLILNRAGLSFFNPIARRYAETGDFNKMARINYLPLLVMFLIRSVPVFLALHFGSGIIETIVAKFPPNIMTGLSVAGKILPAVGIGLLMTLMIQKGQMWVFLILGFSLAIYLELSILPITLISLPFALLYDLSTNKEEDTKNEEGGYDL